jgi:hypothetical protein
MAEARAPASLKGKNARLERSAIKRFCANGKRRQLAYRVKIGNANKIAEQLAKRAAQLKAQVESKKPGL